MMAETNIGEYFMKCQLMDHNHEELSMKLMYYMRKDEDKRKQKTFLQYFTYSMTVGTDTDDNVHLVLDFISQFIFVCIRENMSILNYLCTTLSSMMHKESKSIRYRSTYLHYRLLKWSGDINKDIVDSLHMDVVERMQDKTVLVREMALKVMLLYTEGYEHVCSEQIHFVMCSESNRRLRLMALEGIRVTSQSLPQVLQRRFDIEVDIRQMFYSKMKKEVLLDQLSIADRVKIVQSGLLDNTKEVKDACRDMILQSWLPKCNDDPLKLLHVLDVQHDEQVGTLVAKVLVDKNVLPKASLGLCELDQGLFTCEMALYWKIQMQSNADSPYSIVQVVDIAFYNSFLTKLLMLASSANRKDSQEIHTFIMEQALQVGATLEYYKNDSTESLLKTLAEMLEQRLTNRSNMESLVKLYYKISNAIGADEQAVHAMVQVLKHQHAELLKTQTQTNDVDHTIVQQAALRLAEIDKRLNALVLEDKMDEEYEQLEAEATNIENSLDNPLVHQAAHFLQLICEVLPKQVSKDDQITAYLPTVLSFVQHASPLLRELAVRGLGYFSKFDEALAQSQVALFWKISNTSDEDIDVRIASLKSCVDLHFVFSNFISALGSESEIRLESNLVAFLQSENSDLQFTAVEASCKLLLSGQFSSTHILLETLIRLYFDTDLEDPPYVQLMAAFFTIYSAKHSDALITAMWSFTCNCAYESDSNHEPSMEFMLFDLDESVHDTLAKHLLVECLANLQMMSIWCPYLDQLRLPTSTPTIWYLTRQLLDLVPNLKASTSLHRFSKSMKKPSASLSASEEQTLQQLIEHRVLVSSTHQSKHGRQTRSSKSAANLKMNAISP